MSSRSRALILSGADVGEAHVESAEAQLITDLEARGFAVRLVRLRDHRLGYCVGCFECWTRTPGECRLRDDGWSLGSAVIESDLLVLATAIRFGGYASELKKAVDRLLSLLLPFFTTRDGRTYHSGRYARYPALLGLGVQRRVDPEEARIFRELVRRNALNLCAPRAAACILDPASDVRHELRSALDRTCEAVTA